MKLIYPAIFHTEDDSVWVEFPDLEGCNTFGDTIEETLANAQEAMEGYCITMLETQHKLPKASDIKTLKTDENSFSTLVEADLTTHLSKQKSIKKTLTIPSWMNDMAVEQGINFSAVLQNALKEQLNINE